MYRINLIVVKTSLFICVLYVAYLCIVNVCIECKHVRQND